MSEQPSATSFNALNQLGIDQAAMGYAVLNEVPLFDSLRDVRAGHDALGEDDRKWLESPAAANMLQLQQLHSIRHLNLQMQVQAARTQFDTYLHMAPMLGQACKTEEERSSHVNAITSMAQAALPSQAVDLFNAQPAGVWDACFIAHAPPRATRKGIKGGKSNDKLTKDALLASARSVIGRWQQAGADPKRAAKDQARADVVIAVNERWGGSANKDMIIKHVGALLKELGNKRSLTETTTWQKSLERLSTELMRLKAPIVVPNTDDSLDQPLENETPEDDFEREQRALLRGLMRQELLATYLEAKVEFARNAWSTTGDVKTTQLDLAIQTLYLPGRLHMLLILKEDQIKIYHGKPNQRVDVVSYGPTGRRTTKKAKFSSDRRKSLALSEGYVDKILFKSLKRKRDQGALEVVSMVPDGCTDDKVSYQTVIDAMQVWQTEHGGEEHAGEDFSQYLSFVIYYPLHNSQLTLKFNHLFDVWQSQEVHADKDLFFTPVIPAHVPVLLRGILQDPKSMITTPAYIDTILAARDEKIAGWEGFVHTSLFDVAPPTVEWPTIKVYHDNAGWLVTIKFDGKGAFEASVSNDTRDASKAKNPHVSALPEQALAIEDAAEKPGPEATTVGTGEGGSGQADVLSVRKKADDDNKAATTSEEPGTEEAAAAVEGTGAVRAAPKSQHTRKQANKANKE